MKRVNEIVYLYGKQYDANSYENATYLAINLSTRYTFELTLQHPFSKMISTTKSCDIYSPPISIVSLFLIKSLPLFLYLFCPSGSLAVNY